MKVKNEALAEQATCHHSQLANGRRNVSVRLRVSKASLLNIAANISASMESNIKSIEETQQSLYSLLSKVPAEYRPDMTDVIAGADQAVVEARQRLDRYHSIIG